MDRGAPKRSKFIHVYSMFAQRNRRIATALDYFRFRTHTETDAFYVCALPKPERMAQMDLVPPSEQRVLYAGPQQAELLQCKRYLLPRVQGTNANTFVIREGLEQANALKTTQGQRWYLVKLHHTGHITSQRRHDADPR